MKITIEIEGNNEMEKLSALFKTFEINSINVISSDNTIAPIIKGDKKVDPKDLFGIWSKKPRSIENIRKNAWQRKNPAG